MNNKSEYEKRLYKAILNLKNEEECSQFFEDLCTIKEIRDMAQRLETAHLLNKGESYITISKQIGVSSATIGRVNKCLLYGNGGYKTALERLENDA